MDTDEFVDTDVAVADFKLALGCFATGVTVATTASPRGVHGVTANAVMSVSLQPALVALSIQAGSRMDAALKNSDNFALSVLSATQKDVAEYFADPSTPHDARAFLHFPCRRARTGAPLLHGALAYIDCRIVDIHPAGDHTLFIGHALYVASATPVPPLLYLRGELS